LSKSRSKSRWKEEGDGGTHNGTNPGIKRKKKKAKVLNNQKLLSFADDGLD